MWSALHNTYRYVLVAMAFTMTFFLTPRAWVEGTKASNPEQVPVDALESPESCLWCDNPRPQPANCDSKDDEQLWLNPDHVADPNCDDDSPSSGPNA